MCNSNHTVWKFRDFSNIQILREINFGDSKSAKSAILTHLEDLNFDFYEFFHFLRAEIYQINQTQSRAPKIANCKRIFLREIRLSKEKSTIWKRNSLCEIRFSKGIKV